jgi:hypothetical protein
LISETYFFIAIAVLSSIFLIDSTSVPHIEGEEPDIVLTDDDRAARAVTAYFGDWALAFLDKILTIVLCSLLFSC